MAEKDITGKRDILRMAAMLHDVGKVSISDIILKKPGQFTDDEYSIMKHHAVLGARLFVDGHSEFDRAATDVSLNHHERWDGKGYPGHVDIRTGLPLEGYRMADGGPRGKAGEEIPLFGRIVAIADVYDALISNRVYKASWDEAKVLSLLEKESGSQFDAELIELFFSSLNSIRMIRQRYPDKNQEVQSE
jgi:HD-GYP domain-containing protein (c-di-GMP phosphodiesterase class II)